MHYHVELIMPPSPVVEIQERVRELLYPLSQSAAEMAGTTGRLYDWYQIGGRFAGTKMSLRLDPERLHKFRQELYGEAFANDTRPFYSASNDSGAPETSRQWTPCGESGFPKKRPVHAPCSTTTRQGIRTSAGLTGSPTTSQPTRWWWATKTRWFSSSTPRFGTAPGASSKTLTLTVPYSMPCASAAHVVSSPRRTGWRSRWIATGKPGPAGRYVHSQRSLAHAALAIYEGQYHVTILPQMLYVYTDICV